MDSPHTSRVSFLDNTGITIAVPFEWKAALVEIHASLDDWHSIQLSIQGVPLSVRIENRFGQDRLLADWVRSGTGNYRVTLQIGDYTEERTITIHPQRISQAAYSTMVDDLQRRLPTSIAIGLQKAGALTGIKLLSPEANVYFERRRRLVSKRYMGLAFDWRFKSAKWRASVSPIRARYSRRNQPE